MGKDFVCPRCRYVTCRCPDDLGVADPETAPVGGAYVRQYLRANLFDGDEGGVLTVKIRDHLDVLVELFLDIHHSLVDDPHLFDGQGGAE